MKIFNEENYHIKSVSDFLKINYSLLYTSDFDPGKWIFRGECNHNYTLKPSLGRLLHSETFPTKEKLLNFEKSAFSEFSISTYNELRETNQFMLLAVAQHHGLKTRLLDWTFSPLIALFFAVENELNSKNDGALITFQTHFPFNTFPEKTVSPFDEWLDKYHFLFMPDLSPRIRAQQGVFQLFKDPTQEFSQGYNLAKFRIPSASKQEIKRELNDLGISYKTVFPDLNGLCKTINYEKLKD